MLPFRRGAAWQTLFLLCALAYCINEASSEGRVVCYYTNWSVYRPGTAKFNPQNINPYLCTHLVYAFGGFTKDNQMKPFDKYQDIEQGGYAKFTGLKTYNKQLKTMIAIGGWNEASSRFSPLVASGDRRQQFIKNILKFLRQNHFDGIDLDWEYPAHREGGKSRDRDNYAQFVQELRAEFEREAEKTGRTRLLLTMAVPAGIEYIDKGYDVPKLNKYLDWFNVLTYDFHSSHEPSVNHHAPLYSLEEDSEYNYDAELNIDYSIKYYLKAGADRDKLVLGIPTYGRSYTLINEESTELGAPSEGPGEQGDATREKGYLAYYEICQTLKDDPEWTVVQPNANVMGPYAYRRNQWVGYDDEAIVRKKAEYVVAQGLGGIMFWAIDNDDFRGTCNGKPYPLIEAAKEAMVEALGLGINEVAKSSGPQKPSRSRSRDNASTRNRLNGKTEAPANSRRPSAPRRPAISSTTSTQAPPPSTTFKLTEAEGSSLYIGGRGSTTPPPPTTPDPGSDFKCEEEGFFQHPRDCKKYYWCLDSGPSGLGIVAHMFTCPSGLYFNPAADSCDFARNVPCKTKKSTTAAPVTTSTSTTTTARPNRVTAAPTARPVYPRPTTSTSTTTTTTTTTPAAIEEDLEYEEDTDELSPSKSTDAEEDPQVIKELIDLIRKVGGVEQLEKHLLRNKDGSITLKENSASGAATTPSTISKSLYDRVLSRPGTLSSFTRNRFKISEATETSTEASSSSSTSSGTGNNYSKYSSVLRGNSRQGPQNEGIEKLAEFDGFLKERKQYVTINRHRSAGQGEEEETQEQQEEEQQLADVATTTRRPLSSVTPSYTSLRRTRPTTVAPAADHSQEEVEEQTQTPVKSYATLSRTRGRTTAAPSEVTEASPSSTTNRYKYFERTRPTKSATAEDVEDPLEEEEEEYEDEALKEHVTVQSKQTTNTRKYASIGRRTTTTTATPETTTTTTAGTETAKASTTNSTTTNNNNKNHYNSSNNYNNVKLNNQIPTEESTTTTATPSTIQPETTSTTTTTTNEPTEPNESTTSTTTSAINNLHTTTPTTPLVGSTIPPTSGLDSDSLLASEPSEPANPTQPPLNPDSATTTTSTEPELVSTTTTTTTTPKTTTTTTTSTGNSELNDVDNVDSENSEVTKTKTQYGNKYATTNRRRITTTTTNSNSNNNAEAANDASPTRNGLSSLNSFRTNPGRRQPTQEPNHEQTTVEPSPSVSSPRPFGYPRRRTRPTASTSTSSTAPQTDNDNNTDNDNLNVNDNINETDAVAKVVKKTRLSPGDRPKNRYQLSRTRGTTTTTPPPSTSTQSPTAANARRLAFGARQRAQVTKLTLVEEQTAEETEAKAQPHEPVEDDAASVAETESNEDSTETGTTTTTRPTPKRIRVLKFRRPLNSNSNSSTVDSTTNSATDTNPDTQTTATATPPTTTSNTNTTVGTNGKRFRKIVRKLRPVDSSTAASVDNSEETTRKPFVPSHSRFVDQEQNQTDLLSLRQRLKEQQAKGEPQDGVISSRFKASGQKDDQENVSDLQKLRDKVKAEQARGDGDQGVINDRLKKLLAEKSTGTSRQGQDSASPARDDEQSSSVSSPRPFFKRKLVARRPYTPSSASGGSPGTTKAPLAFSTSRPTAKFVRRKNGRFDPFNSSVRNRGEGFVRSDPRGARLPGTDRFKTQGNEDDEEELEAQQEHPLQNQFGTNLRRPFVPKTRPVLDKSKTQQEDGGEDSEEDDEEEDEDSEEEGDEEEDEDEETGEKKTTGGEEKPSEDTNTNKPKFNSPYRPKDNRMPPGSRPNFGTTGSGAPTAPGNVPFNPRNRPPTGPGSSNTNNPPNRFGSTKRPRVVNRPPGVASPNLTLKPVASDYERTTPLTPLKPAPFIPSNTRSYERKYSGPSTEAAETASENSLIEDLNIDALNARNKKIFDKHSKKHTTLKPKVSKVETEAGVGLGAEVETGTEVATEEETTFSADQGYVTTTPSTPAPPPPPSPPSTQLDTATATNTDTPPETETETEPVTDTETATNANEATSSVNSQDQPNHTTQSSTTQAPPPATTLLHVFTLIEGEGEGEDEHTTTRRPAVRLLPTIQTEVVPKHKVVEINRIVEINSKQAKAAQRKSKANQDFGTLRVESLPHVEQLGEISVVKYVHLVDGSDIQINDGHSTVADYTPTEPTTRASGQSNSPPVRNSVPETEGSDRDGKSLLPEVLSGALETSTISLEGLFDSARKGKQLSTNSIFAGGELPTEEEESTTILSSSASATENGESTTLAPTYVRPIVPLLRPESNESSPLVISIANLDQVILSKVQKSLAESNGSSTTMSPAAADSNSAFSVRQAQVVQAPVVQTSDNSDQNNPDQTQTQITTTVRTTADEEETTIFVLDTTTTASTTTTSTQIPVTTDSGGADNADNGQIKQETLIAMPIGAAIISQLGQGTQTLTTGGNQEIGGSGAISSEAVNPQTTGTLESEQQVSDSGSTSGNNQLNTQTTTTTTTTSTTQTSSVGSGAVSGGAIGGSGQVSVGSRVSEAVSFSSETHVVHRKKMSRKGRGGRRLRKTTTTATPATTTTTETASTVETDDIVTTVIPVPE
ncbi:mucin-19 isoform X2 [Drosophila serrata]|uniref:mucin-19 isoform X2 n=1 Tax=Drosophila serrata TaxID=7274 RepID=UPI000A1D0493|nr:mucin-19 isoform X2 [Drosophila serrata]